MRYKSFKKEVSNPIVRPMLFLVFIAIVGYVTGIMSSEAMPQVFIDSYSSFIHSIPAQLSLKASFTNTLIISFLAMLITYGVYSLCAQHKLFIVLGVIQIFIFMMVCGIAAGTYKIANGIKIILMILLFSLPSLLIAISWSTLFSLAITSKNNVKSLSGWIFCIGAISIQIVASVIFSLVVI